MPGQKAGEAERREQILAAALQVALRQGLDGLTVRRVAEAAGLSHGLVHFHYKSKDALLSALLDRVLDTTAAFEMPAALVDEGAPIERLLALLQREIARLSGDRGRIQLFFDFWLIGNRNRAVRTKMRAELAQYREAFRSIVEQTLEAEPDRLAGVTIDGLTSVLVAFIKGSALQAVIDRKGFDVAEFTFAANALLSQLQPAGAR